MSNDVQGQGPVERMVRPDSEARHLPTPEDLRNYADDADQHGNHWVPIAPASLRGLADEIERLRAELCLTIADTDAKAIDFVRLLAKANDQAEHFERNWYLRGDAIEAAGERSEERWCVMDRKTANKIWRDVARGAPDGVPTSRTLHDFAQRVEESTIARLHAKHQPALGAGGELANVAFNFAQKVGHALTSDDVEMLDSLRKKWDESRKTP